MEAAPLTAENFHSAELATCSDLSDLETLDNHRCGLVTTSHNTCGQSQQNQRSQRIEAKSEAAAAFSCDNELSGILMDIMSRLDRMESTNLAHQDFSQKHMLEHKEVMANLMQSVGETRSTFASLRKEIRSLFDDVGTVHGLRKPADVGVGSQGQSAPQQRNMPSTIVGSVSLERHESPNSEGRGSSTWRLSGDQPITRTESMRASSLQRTRAAMEKATRGSFRRQEKSHMFTSSDEIEQMKHEVLSSILRPYDVSQYYHRGVCARIAMHPSFELSALIVVALNAVWIGIDVDINGSDDTPDKDIVYQFIEYFFFAFFVLEILIRFGAFRRKRDCLKDCWFIFDSALVALMCFDTIIPLVANKGLGFDTSIITLARLIKLSRMGRIANLLLKVPEVSLLMHGFGIACRAVLAALLLLLCLVYVFAVTFRYLTVDTNVGHKYFRTVPFAMRSLAISATMPDAEKMIKASGAEHVLVGLLVVLFMLFASLTLLNFLVGMICQVVSTVAAAEKEKTRVLLVEARLSHALRASGNDDLANGLIGKLEFEKMLLDANVARTLRDLDVDPVGLFDFMDYIFLTSAGLEHGVTFHKIVELICALGGTNTATVKDVVDMRQVVIGHLADIENSLDQLMQAHLKFAPLGATDYETCERPSLSGACTLEAI